MKLGKREIRRRERQDAVISTTLSLIQTYDFRSITMAMIAKEMGASVGGLYRYYESKEAIFAALQIQAIDALDMCLDNAIERSDAEKSRFQRLEDVVRAFESWSAFRFKSPILFQLLDQFISAPERTLDDVSAHTVEHRLAPLLSRLTGLLDAATSAGIFQTADNQARTHILWAAMHGLEHFRKRDDRQAEGMRVDHLRPQLLQAILVGWGAPRGLVDTVLTKSALKPQ